MPVVVQDLMLAAPTTHFTELSQAILTAAPGWRWWVQFLALAVIGSVRPVAGALSAHHQPDGPSAALPQRRVITCDTG
jgi:hypothetical protein